MGEETAAYLDGELDCGASLLFETHLQECISCSAELKEQQRLLCALDFALSADAPGLELPLEFARIVAANAESDMSGVRQHVENRRALWLCMALGLSSLILLGAGTLYAAISIPIRVIVKSSLSMFGVLSTSFYDAGASAAVILRAVERRLIFESYYTVLIASLFFAIAVTLLPRLIVKYHRAQLTQ